MKTRTYNNTQKNVFMLSGQTDVLAQTMIEKIGRFSIIQILKSLNNNNKKMSQSKRKRTLGQERKYLQCIKLTKGSTSRIYKELLQIKKTKKKKNNPKEYIQIRKKQSKLFITLLSLRTMPRRFNKYLLNK